MENYADAVETTLVTDSGTTISVASVAGFPAANFRIRIDDELLLVTSVTGTDFTVTRGIEGTTEVTHDSGKAVKHVLTAGAIAQIRAEYVLTGTYADRPAAGLKGRTYRATDNPYLYYDTGAAWQAYGPEMRAFVTPPTSNWITNAQEFKNYILKPTTISLYGSYAVRAVSAPYIITLAVNPTVIYNKYGGVCWRESATNKFHVIGFTGSSYHILSVDYLYERVFTNRYASTCWHGAWNNALWLKLADNNTTRTVSYSYDGGYNWLEVYSTTRTTDLTPDQIGLFLYQGTDTKYLVELLSWEQE